MGTWSVDIIGGDEALDILDELSKIIGLSGDDEIGLYPLPLASERSWCMVVKDRLERHRPQILEHDWGENSLHRSPFPIITTPYLSVGAYMPLGLREKALQALNDEIRGMVHNNDWDDPQARVDTLVTYRRLLREHETHKITEVPYTGLFATMGL